MATGCTRAVIDRADGLAAAGRRLANLIASGGTAPTTYTVAGEELDVAVMSVTSGTDITSTLVSALGGAGTNRIVVLPPGQYTAFSTNATIDILGAGTVFSAYGATIRSTSVQYNEFEMTAANQGIQGLRGEAHYIQISRWPERWDNAPTVEAGKDDVNTGTDASPVHPNRPEFNTTRTDLARSVWATVGAGGNNFVQDCSFIGGRGATRFNNSVNSLMQRCTSTRMHSDSFRIYQEALDITVQDCSVFQSGDDCISVVTHDRINGVNQPDRNFPPRNVLIYNNTIQGARVRGITVIGGDDVTISRNTIEETIYAGVLLYPANTHTRYDVTNVEIIDNTFLRCGKFPTAFSNGGIIAAIHGTDGKVREAVVERNRIFTYGEFYAGSTVRSNGTPASGVSTFLQGTGGDADVVTPLWL